jgi:hypothetical protein
VHLVVIKMLETKGGDTCYQVGVIEIYGILIEMSNGMFAISDPRPCGRFIIEKLFEVTQKKVLFT